MVEKEGAIMRSEYRELKERSYGRMPSIQVYDSSWRVQDVSGYKEELLLGRHEEGCWFVG